MIAKIKNNKSAGDNGYWMLYVGCLLIGLSVIGIIYFIAATVSDKKKSSPNNRNGKSGGDKNSSGGRSSKSAKNYYTAEESRKRRNSRLGDTADIYLPRRGPTRYGGEHME